MECKLLVNLEDGTSSALIIRGQVQIGRGDSFQECIDSGSISEESLFQGLGLCTAGYKAFADDLNTYGAAVHILHFSKQFRENFRRKTLLKPRDRVLLRL